MYYCVERVKLACLIDNSPLLTAGAGLGEVLGTIEKALYKRPPSLWAQPGQCTCVGCGRLSAPWVSPRPHPTPMFITSPRQETWVSAGMKMVLVFNKAILQRLLHLRGKKNCGGGKHNRPCQIYFSPQSRERQRKSQAYLPDTKGMCSLSKFKPVNSAHYPGSRVSTSVPLKTIPMAPFTQAGFIFVGSRLKPSAGRLRARTANSHIVLPYLIPSTIGAVG